jgi:hypothetical protein
MNLARALDCSSAEAFGTQLASTLRDFRGNAEPLDDETIIVMRTPPAASSARSSR